jgi:hypothetical protein
MHRILIFCNEPTLHNRKHLFFTKPIILFPAVIDQIKIIGDYIQNITMKDFEKMSYYCNYFKCVFMTM